MGIARSSTSHPNGPANHLSDEPACSGDAPEQQKSVHCPPDAESFFSMGERLTRVARRRGQPVSLLVLQVPDLPEVELLFGRHAAEEAVRTTMEQLVRLADGSGLAGRTRGDTFAVLAPCSLDELQARLRVRFGQACSLEVDVEGEEIVLVPDVQTRMVAEGDSVEKAYSRTIESTGHIEVLRRDCEPQHTDFQSTMVTLPPAVPEKAGPRPGADRRWRKTLPATIPMPIPRP